MLYRSKTDLVLWLDIAIATRSGTPAQTIFPYSGSAEIVEQRSFGSFDLLDLRFALSRYRRYRFIPSCA
jgi:hypothetical protein